MMVPDGEKNQLKGLIDTLAATAQRICGLPRHRSLPRVRLRLTP